MKFIYLLFYLFYRNKQHFPYKSDGKFTANIRFRIRECPKMNHQHILAHHFIEDYNVISKVWSVNSCYLCSGSNACVLNNGGCRFLCLPTPNGGRTCACPDNVDEDECNRIGLLL